MKLPDWVAPLSSLLGIAVLAAFAKWPPDKPGDWATWVTAAGTIGAVAVALGLSTRDNRRQATLAMDAARLTAASVTMRLSRAGDEIDNVVKLFESQIHHNVGAQKLFDANRVVNEIVMPSKEDQLALLALPNNCAINLAKAEDRLAAVKATLRIFSEYVVEVDAREKLKIASKGKSLMLEASRFVGDALAECEKASCMLAERIN